MGKGVPSNQQRLGWVQHIFPSGKFRRLLLLSQFLRCLPDNLFFRGNGRYNCHAVGLSLLSWTGRSPLQRSYTFKNFFVQEGEVASSPVTPSHFWPTGMVALQ